MNRIWAAGLLGLGLLAGCTPAEEARVQQGVKGTRQELQQGLNQAQQAAVNQALEAQVKQVLMARKGLDTRGIDVEVKGGTVTLRGDVQSPDQARLAEQVAMEVEGVQAVINQLTMRVPATGSTTTTSPGTTTGPATHPAQGVTPR